MKLNRLANVLALFILTACAATAPKAEAPVSPPAKSPGQLRFEEKCRTVAGEKIYKTVPEVEGVLLMKVRPARGERELADRMWPGAAFAKESRADEYITTFLGYEHSSSQKGEPVTPKYRGYIGTDFQPRNASNLPGYRYVDVIDEKDGKRYRITGSYKDVERVIGYLAGGDGKTKHVFRDYVLDKTPTTAPAPRYGVTYEDHVIPEDRELGIASSTVKVIDLQTNEVLGEMIRYAWGYGTPTSANPSPWLAAWVCPGHAVGAGAATRKFVDQILIPVKEK